MPCRSSARRREARLRVPGSSQAALVDYTVTPMGDVDGRPRQLLILELQPLDRLLRISREDSLLAA